MNAILTKRESDTLRARVDRARKRRHPKQREWTPDDVSTLVAGLRSFGATVEAAQVRRFLCGDMPLMAALEFMASALRAIQPQTEEEEEDFPTYAPAIRDAS